MTTVADLDRQVLGDDAIAARLWPRLGPKVRTSYLRDRDAWIAIRRDVDAGKQPSAEALQAQREAFAGWARAFHRASQHHQRRASHLTTPIAAAGPATLDIAAPKPPAPIIKASTGNTASAVAGGLVLAGLIAFAARRKRP